METKTSEQPVKVEVVKKWYKTWWGIIGIFLLWPILLPLIIWKHTNWSKGGKIVATLLIVLVAILSVGALGDSQPTEPEKVGEAEKEQTTKTQSPEPEKPSSKTYKIGDEVKLEGKVLTVHSVSPYTSKNQFIVPENGNKFVVVDITMRNGSDEAFDFNFTEFKLQDNKDYTYDDAFTDKEPSISLEVIQPGQKFRGFLDYEIPKSNTPTKLIFTPGFLSLSQIIIELN